MSSGILNRSLKKLEGLFVPDGNKVFEINMEWFTMRDPLAIRMRDSPGMNPFSSSIDPESTLVAAVEFHLRLHIYLLNEAHITRRVVP